MLGADVMINKKQSKGFSLVELMVAMVIGLVIISGAFSLHSGSRKTQLKNEEQMDMVADAKFAIDMISYDLRHAGMWGATNKSGLIRCRSSDTACVASSVGEAIPTNVVGDCEAGWYYDLPESIFATDSANPHAACIPDTEGYVAGTDVLEIRYADANAIDSLKLRNGQAYIRSNFTNGRVFLGAKAPTLDSYDTSPLTKNHELRAYAYYVSNHTDSVGDGIPSLRRVALVNGPTLQNQTLISGVTDLQVQFGEDVDGDEDSTIDRYVNPADVSDWTKVYSAKIWLLMRTDNIQHGITTTKSFTMAGATADYGADGYRYFMVTSVVNLRNRRQL